MKKLFAQSVVVVALVVVLSLLIAGVALAGGGWNKWQPIVDDYISGTFKFSATTWMVKDYHHSFWPPDLAFDLVGYLDMPLDEAQVEFEEYCYPQGADHLDSFAKGWIETLTGRDMSFVEQPTVYLCVYPAGWHDAQP